MSDRNEKNNVSKIGVHIIIIAMDTLPEYHIAWSNHRLADEIWNSHHQTIVNITGTIKTLSDYLLLFFFLFIL